MTCFLYHVPYQQREDRGVAGEGSVFQEKTEGLLFSVEVENTHVKHANKARLVKD